MEVDHEFHAGPGHGFGDLVKVFAGSRERLFDDDVFAGARGGDNRLAVREVGRSDGDSVNIRIAQHLAVIGVNAAGTPPVRGLARAGFIDIADRGERGPVIRRVSLRVHISPGPRANQSESDSFHGSQAGSARWKMRSQLPCMIPSMSA